MLLDRLMIPEEIAPRGKHKIFKAKGCEKCRDTGFKGRISLFEIMQMSEEIKALTLKRAAAYEIKKQAIKEGMVTLQHSGWQKVLAGVTTLEEVLSVTEEV